MDLFVSLPLTRKGGRERWREDGSEGRDAPMEGTNCVSCRACVSPSHYGGWEGGREGGREGRRARFGPYLLLLLRSLLTAKLGVGIPLPFKPHTHTDAREGGREGAKKCLSPPSDCFYDRY